MVRVLVIAESSQRAETIRAGLQLAAHELTEIVSPNGSVPAALDRTRPDIIVLEKSSPSMDLLDALVTAMGSKTVPLVIFAADGSAEAVERAIRAGAAAYVIDGLQAARVPAILQVATARFEFMARLRSDLETAQQKLAERKIVERAKGLLMKARNLSEDEAYHTLRRMAMERNRRMGEVAKSVLEMADLLSS
jgi:two-component system, response regulator / RNA-binding antiterminator